MSDTTHTDAIAKVLARSTAEPTARRHSRRGSFDNLPSMYGDGRVYKRGETYWIEFWHKGTRHRTSAKTSNKREARQRLRIRQAELALGTFRGLTAERARVEHILSLIVDDYQESNRPSLPQLLSRVEKHLKPRLGKIRCAEFGKDDVRRYKAHRRAKGGRTATVNRELEVLRRAFRLGSENKPPLVAYLPIIKLDSEDNIRTGFVEDSRYTALRDALNRHLRLMAVIGYHTGLRAGIIRGIEWEWVDLKAANIRLPKGVHNKRNPALVPIYGDMGAELEMAKAEHDEFWPACPFVVHIRGRQVNPDITHQSGWRSACKAADVEGLLFHDLRRSAIRNMRRAGIPENEAMAISGHRTRSVFQRYDIISEKDIERAAAKLEALQVRERAGAEEERAVQ